MKELVFLLEERSAQALLEALLPRILDIRIVVRAIPFEGKQDLENQLVRKLRGYLNPEARFIVLRDQDSAPDCKIVKRRLSDLCDSAGKRHVSLVRIACRELESMYLADLNAVEHALGQIGVAKHQQTAAFRRPDLLENPSHILKRLKKGRYQKIESSRQIARYLDLDNVRSTSFMHLIAGIRRLEAELLR